MWETAVTVAVTFAPSAARQTGRRPRRLARIRFVRAMWWLFEFGLFAAAMATIVVVGSAFE